MGAALPASLSVEALDNPLWYRVSELRPRLRAHVRIQRRATRGQVWYLLIDPDSGRFHRVNRAAYEFIGRINGRDNVETLWRHVHQRLGEAAPSQTEVVQMLAQLADADLISADALPDLAAFLGRKRRRRRQEWLAAVNPLAFKLRLFDPSRLLDHLAPLGVLFSRGGLVLWLAWMLLGGLTALHWAAPLGHAFATLGLAHETLLAMWLAYPVVKGLHELAHGLAVRAFGGTVREMGLTLLMLTPVPYVDASAAHQFPERRRRIAVSAAGIMAELAIAVAALFVWRASGDPGVQQAALAVMLLCGLSTVMFNANPLMRFDGYFMLSDALEQPNLAGEAQAVVNGALQRLLGVRATVAPRPRGEALGLAAYALASLAWRVIAGFAVLLWLHEPYPLVALMVALLMGWGLLVKPLGRALAFLAWDARLGGRRLRAYAVAGAAALALLAGLGALPAPSNTVQQGVVWLSDEAVVRAPSDATLESVERDSGEHVEPGDAIATLANPELHSERESARARLAQLEVNYYDALLTDPARAHALGAERSALVAQIERLDQRAEDLVLRARVAGTLVLPRGHGDPGRYFPQGREIGYILTGEPPVVKVAYTEAQAARLRESTRSVAVRLADRADEAALAARIERSTPQAQAELPSPVLGAPAGGPIATDPADPQGRRTLQPVHVVDVRVDGLTPTHIGQRAWVRVGHDGEPLAAQWGRQLRQLFLRSLGARE